MSVSIPGSDEQAMRIPNSDEQAISLDEASRQLELAVHDAQVAFDCIALGNLDRAHTNAVTARAAADAAETLLRAVLGRIARAARGPGRRATRLTGSARCRAAQRAPARQRDPRCRAAGYLARRGSRAEATTTPATAATTSTATSSARLVGTPMSSPRSASTS